MIPGTYLKNTAKDIYPKTLLFIVFSLAIVFLYSIFSIFPGYRTIKKIRQDIDSTTADMAVLQKIIPVYAEARKYSKLGFEHNLPLPDRKGLEEGSVAKLVHDFQSLSLKHKLDLSRNKLDIKFSRTQPDSVFIFIELNGSLHNFRNFLISLISLPFFEKIENIMIRPDNNNFKIFSVNIKINVKNKHEQT